jgi:hypothetical protein
MSQDSMYLVVGLYAYDDLLEHTARAFEGFELFNGLADPGYKLVWECIRDTYLNTGAKPTPRMLVNQCMEHLASIDIVTRDRAEAQVVSVFANDNLGSGTELLKREHVQALLKTASRRAAVDKMLTVSTLDDKSSDGLIEHVSDVATMLKNVVPKRSVRKRPLAKEERTRLLRVTKRWRWGIDYWDEAGLTWYKKEIHGLLGPTGGGKTTNMTNIATRQLKEGRKVLIALYEQCLEEDVEQRILSNLANVSMNELRDRNEEDIDPKVRDKIDAACEKYVDNLVVFDMVGEDAGTGGVEELKAQIAEEEKETGFFPDLIIVDWLGEMVTRYEKLGSGDSAKRQCHDKFMSEIVQYKEDRECSFLILHQTNTIAQSMSPGSKPDKTMSHEFRSFANKCDTCSVLGVMDHDLKVCWFIPDKSRRSQSITRKIKLDGEYMRFRDVSKEYTLVGHTFMSTRALEEQAAEAERNRNDGDEY